MQLSEKELAEHLYVLGGTGVGKSRALEGWALWLIKQGRGVAVLDPHGELIDNTLARLAPLEQRVKERLVLFDPLHPTHTVGFNPLQLLPGEVAERRAQFLAGVITKIFRVDELIAARMQRLMFHAFWLLIVNQATLAEFSLVLTNKAVRSRLLAALPEAHKLRQYWESEFPESDRLVSEWTQSSLNKAGQLTTDPDFELILGGQQSTLDFRSLLDEEKILLVRLPKGELTEYGAHLMGALLVAQLFLAALSRARERYQKPKRFTLFLDEFQNYVTDDIHEALAESRKYGLSLVMAHQFYEQLRPSPELKAAVINTVGSLVCFRLGASDSQFFVRDVFSPPLDQEKDRRVRMNPTGLRWWPYVRVEDTVWRPWEEILEQEMRRLTMLEKRQFWFKRRGPQPPVLLRTHDLPDVVLTPRLARTLEALVNSAMARYGRDKAGLRAEITARQARLLGLAGPDKGAKKDDDDPGGDPLPPYGVYEPEE